MSEPDVLLDNVVLSNFLLAGAADVLVALGIGRFGVTSDVVTENAAGRAAGHAELAGLDELIAAGQVTHVVLSLEERAVFVELVRFLGRGEASSIAVAGERRVTFASDDLVARETAERRGILVTGAIGLLVAAVRRDILSLERADAVLTGMIERGFFSPVRSLAGLV